MNTDDTDTIGQNGNMGEAGAGVFDPDRYRIKAASEEINSTSSATQRTSTGASDSNDTLASSGTSSGNKEVSRNKYIHVYTHI